MEEGIPSSNPSLHPISIPGFNNSLNLISISSNRHKAIGRLNKRLRCMDISCRTKGIVGEQSRVGPSLQHTRGRTGVGNRRVQHPCLSQGLRQGTRWAWTCREVEVEAREEVMSQCRSSSLI